jgi:hypothetical protein
VGGGSFFYTLSLRRPAFVQIWKRISRTMRLLTLTAYRNIVCGKPLSPYDYRFFIDDNFNRCEINGSIPKSWGGILTRPGSSPKKMTHWKAWFIEMKTIVDHESRFSTHNGLAQPIPGILNYWQHANENHVADRKPVKNCYQSRIIEARKMETVIIIGRRIKSHRHQRTRARDRRRTHAPW